VAIQTRGLCFINYIHFNPVKAGLVKSAGEYQWSSFRSFYLREKDVPIEVDREWWWPEDVKKLAVAAKQCGAKRWRTRPRRKGHNLSKGGGEPPFPTASFAWYG
jgi:hypothetical protein